MLIQIARTELMLTQEKLMSLRKYHPAASWILVDLDKGRAVEAVGPSIKDTMFRPANIDRISFMTHDKAIKYNAAHPGMKATESESYLVDRIAALRKAIGEAAAQ